MQDISKKDKEILYFLDINARKPLRKLAHELNLPENTLRYRIKKLEEKGIIKSYYTMINSYNLGFKVIKFCTKYININSWLQHEIVDFFSNMKNTWVVSSTEGEFDLVAIFWIKDITSFYSIWQEILKNYSQNFTKSKTFFQCEALSFRPTYLIDHKKRSQHEKYDISRQDNKVLVDATNIKILQYLASDARISTVTMSKQLKISSSVIINRIKKLEKMNIIQSYRIEINTSAFGFVHIKADVFLNNFSYISKLITHFKECPYVICIMISIGYSHIEIEFIVKSVTQFHHIMLDFMDKNPNIIKNYDYFQIPIVHKLRWIPEIKC